MLYIWKENVANYDSWYDLWKNVKNIKRKPRNVTIIFLRMFVFNNIVGFLINMVGFSKLTDALSTMKVTVQCDRANAWDPTDLKITLGKWGEDT